MGASSEVENAVHIACHQIFGIVQALRKPQKTPLPPHY